MTDKIKNIEDIREEKETQKKEKINADSKRWLKEAENLEKMKKSGKNSEKVEFLLTHQHSKILAAALIGAGEIYERSAQEIEDAAEKMTEEEYEEMKAEYDAFVNSKKKEDID